MGNPGGGAPGGGGSPPVWAAHTKLINTNKIEATILLFCIIMVYKCIKNRIGKIITLQKTFVNRPKYSTKCNYSIVINDIIVKKVSV